MQYIRDACCIKKLFNRLTKAVEVVILVPPEAPTTNLTCPSESATILGHMEDRGRFPGLMKFAADAGTPKWLVVFGVEKSSIWLLNITPVFFPTTFDPKLYFEKKLQTWSFLLPKMCLYLVNCATIYKKDFKTIMGRLISIYVLTLKQIQTNLTQLKEIYLLKIYGTS